MLRSPRQRLQALAGPASQPSAGREPAISTRRLALAAATLIAGPVGIGGLVGLLVGLGAAAGILLTARPAPAPAAAAGEVPIVVELLAGCLAAGLALPEALDASSAAADDVTREACAAAAAALRRGAPAGEAWQAWLADPTLEAVARTTMRTTHTGAAVAEDLRRVAARLRAQRHSRLQQRVQQASVWSVIPLGLFFLPAFVLIAVVPTVIGLFGSVR